MEMDVPHQALAYDTEYRFTLIAVREGFTSPAIEGFFASRGDGDNIDIEIYGPEGKLIRLVLQIETDGRITLDQSIQTHDGEVITDKGTTQIYP